MKEHEPDVSLEALTRRRFLRTGAALGALVGCARPAEHIVPSVRSSPEQVPGISIPFATATLRDGHAIGIIAESREGRPIKIEGNPEHPASFGGTGAIEQALIRSLYEPTRQRAIEEQGVPQTWDELERTLHARPFVTQRGAGLGVLLGASTSPLLERSLSALRDRFPDAIVAFDPSQCTSSSRSGARLARGRVLERHVDWERCDHVLSIDAEPLSEGPAAIANAKRWSRRRRADFKARLIAIEPTPPLTGMSADARFVVGARDLPSLFASIAIELGPPEWTPFLRPLALPASPEWLRPLLSELRSGPSVILLGESLPTWAHAVLHAMDDALHAPITLRRSPRLDAELLRGGIEPLLDALDSGALDTLITAACNPAFTWPTKQRWRERTSRVPMHVHLGERDETGSMAHVVAPALHDLERWGDARAYEGTWTTIQPLIEPLFGGRTTESFLAMMTGSPFHDRRALRALLEEERADPEEVLSRGFVAQSAFAAERATLDLQAIARVLEVEERASSSRFVLDVRADLKLGIGVHATHPWLQELPDPITKLAWGNAAQMAPSDAMELNIESGDEIEIYGASEGADSRTTIRIPALIQPGQAPGTLTIRAGHGRRVTTTMTTFGTDPLPLVSSFELSPTPIEIRKSGAQGRLIVAQRESSGRDRPIDLQRASREPPPSLYADREQASPQWGMAIDLDLCTGCSACVIACQAENSIPTVGPDQVALGRAMHWLRIDRYFDGDRAAPSFELQPMLCQHCEHAPCEYVCPTHASVHSPDGLNEMVYNRCVGTRFCSHNCPYKVRRFNYFNHHREPAASIERLLLNPDVTTRGRGVMEKCTFCVQRIRRAEIEAHVHGREFDANHVHTACEEACPSEAIVFGPISDPTSHVSHLHADPRAYSELGELGTRPRIRYLTRQRRRAQ